MAAALFIAVVAADGPVEGLEPIVDAGGSPKVANPIRFSATPPSYRLPPPPLP